MDVFPPNLPSVLVVDDLPDAAESLATMLALQGFPVRTATSGEAAMALAAADPPDVVFTDLGMPGMDGFELARRLRCQSDGKKLVVVALTGYATEEDRRKSAAAGIDLHLAKPAAPDVFLDILGRVGRGEPLPGQSWPGTTSPASARYLGAGPPPLILVRWTTGPVGTVARGFDER